MKALKNSGGKRTRSNRSFDIVSIVIGCIVCIFHILGVSIPGWWVLEEVDPRGLTVKYYFGVWSTRTCGDGVCNTETAKMSEERGIKHWNWEIFMLFCRLLIFFFKNKLFEKILSGIPSERQTVCILIRPDESSGLIWVQTVCQGYQQTTLVDRVKTLENKIDRFVNTIAGFL